MAFDLFKILAAKDFALGGGDTFAAMMGRINAVRPGTVTQEAVDRTIARIRAGESPYYAAGEETGLSGALSAREARQGAGGHDVSGVHGTREDFHVFDPSKSTDAVQAVHFGADELPAHARLGYVPDERYDDLTPKTYRLVPGAQFEGGFMMPVTANLGHTKEVLDLDTWPTLGLAQEFGVNDLRGFRDLSRGEQNKQLAKRADSFSYENTVERDPLVDWDSAEGGMGGQSYGVFEPRRLRGRFAMHDPAHKDTPYIMAGGLPFGLVPNKLMSATLPQTPEDPQVFSEGGALRDINRQTSAASQAYYSAPGAENAGAPPAPAAPWRDTLSAAPEAASLTDYARTGNPFGITLKDQAGNALNDTPWQRAKHLASGAGEAVVDFVKENPGETAFMIAGGMVPGIGPNAALMTATPASEVEAAGGAGAAKFISKLAQVLRGSKLGKATGSQWESTLLNQGVKPQELEWTGASKLFAEKAGQPLTLDEVKAAVKPYALGETVKGAAPEFSREHIEKTARAAFDEDWTHGLRDEFLQYEQAPITQELERSAKEEAWHSFQDKYMRESETALADSKAFSNPGSAPRFSEYTMPGGTNYREILMKTPAQDYAAALAAFAEKYELTNNEKEAVRAFENAGRPGVGRSGAQFTSSHWPDDPNTLMHLRVQDRDIGGKKALHVEEVQSDWHQKGSKEGYGPGKPIYKVRNLDSGNSSEAFFSKEAAQEYLDSLPATLRPRVRIEQTGTTPAGLPDAPFKKNWEELGWKRALQEAVNGGYDKLVWTPGAEQAKRYDLRRHISSIVASKSEDGRWWMRVKGKDGELRRDYVSDKDLNEYVGKDMADKIRANEGGEYMGLDLQVGGEGMKAAYDVRARNIIKKLTGQEPKIEHAPTGVGVDDFDVSLPDANGAVTILRPGTPPQKFPSLEAADEFLRTAGRTPVHFIDITPELAEKVRKGLPLFSAGGGAVGLALSASDAKANAKADEPTFDPAKARSPLEVATNGQVHMTVTPKGELYAERGGRSITLPEAEGRAMLNAATGASLTGDAVKALRKIGAIPKDAWAELKGLHRNHSRETDEAAFAAYYNERPDDPAFATLNQKLGRMRQTFKGEDPVALYEELKGYHK